MVKAYYGEDLEYSRRRLMETVVKLVSGTPIYVQSVFPKGEDLWVSYWDLVSDEPDKQCPLEEVDFEPVTLGYLNASGTAIYVARRPMRRDYRQGLSGNSIVLSTGRSWGSIDKKLLCQPILNHYPTKRSALQSLKKESVTSVAVSRDFALQKSPTGLNLLYRNYLVGELVDDIPVLGHKYFFLSEVLQQQLGV